MNYVIVRTKNSKPESVLNLEKHLTSITHVEDFNQIKFFDHLDDAITMLESAVILQNFNGADFSVFKATIDEKGNGLILSEQSFYTQTSENTLSIAKNIFMAFNF